GVFNNFGTVNKIGAGTMTFAVPFGNNGAVNVQAGTLTIQGGGVQAGSLSISPGATLALNTGTMAHVLVPGTQFTGSGQPYVNTSLTFSTANPFSGTTNLNSGTLTLAHSAALQNSSLNLAGGTLNFGTLTSATIGGLRGFPTLTLANNASAP